MPKRKEPPISQAEQSKRFQSEAERLIEAGELSLTDANEAFERLINSLEKK